MIANVSNNECLKLLKLHRSLGKPQKKVLFLVARPLKGRGGNGCATKEKRTVFNVRKKVPMATKPRGGGLKALVAGHYENNFFAASLTLYSTSDVAVCTHFKGRMMER